MSEPVQLEFIWPLSIEGAYIERLRKLGPSEFAKEMMGPQLEFNFYPISDAIRQYFMTTKNPRVWIR
jgi:hypothetical protein